MSHKCSPKGNFVIVFLTRILKHENVFGLHRRERIEVQAILKTAKKRQKNDMQTNAYTHLRFQCKSVEKAFKREYFFPPGSYLFSRISTLGPRGCQKRPQSYPRTAKVPQRVAQGCANVLKRCGNGAPKLLKARKYY